MNTGNNLLFLVVAGLLAFMSVTGYAGMTNLRKLSVEIEPPPELFAGTAAPFTIRVRNRKRRVPSFLLAINCTGMADAGVRIPMVDRDGEAAATAYLVFPLRGMAQIEEVRLTSPFPVGFFFRHIGYRVSRQVLVFPRLTPCPASATSSGRGKTGDRIIPARGMDGELERISPYSGREPLKMIHWKISARSNELMVKEFGAISSEPLIIDLNELPPSDLEGRISCAAWLVRRWVESRPVGLRIGDKTAAAGAGSRHGRRLLAELALIGSDGVREA